MYELHDRSAGRNVGRFRTFDDALDYIKRCVPPARIWNLILGRQLSDGGYLIVSDGPDLRRKLWLD